MSFIFQGIELDWEWPLDSGDKKDKIKLIRYIRVSWRMKRAKFGFREYLDRSFGCLSEQQVGR